MIDNSEKIENLMVFNFHCQKGIDEGSDDKDASATPEDKPAKHSKLSVGSIQGAVRGMIME